LLLGLVLVLLLGFLYTLVVGLKVVSGLGLGSGFLGLIILLVVDLFRYESLR
jgi:hypothetical protein